MALSVPSVLASAGSTSGSHVASTTLTSVSPSANGIMVAGIGIFLAGAGADTDITISDDLNGTGAWTRIQSDYQPATGNRERCALFWAITGADPGTGGIITFTHDDVGTEVRNICRAVIQLTGQSGSSPVPQSLANNGFAGTTFDVDLVTALGGGSRSIGLGVFREGDVANVTPTQNEIVEVDSTGASNIILSLIYGSDTNLDWSGLTNGNFKVGAAIEVAAGAAGNRPGLLLGVGT